MHSFAQHFYYYFGGLTQDTNGKFYGTTYFRGSDDDGTIYTLAQDLKPFVKVQPSTAREGASVSILGSDLKNVTSVSFNGTPATFEIVSDTFVKATVPVGASSGKVEVTGPNYSFLSNVPFFVRP